jgi:hypothetical protein
MPSAFIGHWILDIGYWLLVIGYFLALSGLQYSIQRGAGAFLCRGLVLYYFFSFVFFSVSMYNYTNFRYEKEIKMNKPQQSSVPFSIPEKRVIPPSPGEVITSQATGNCYTEEKSLFPASTPDAGKRCIKLYSHCST